MVPSIGVDIGTWLHYGVYILLALLCLSIVARALWAPLDLFRSTSCGACGHAACDIVSSGGRCPECGGLYNRVGISTVPMAIRLRGSVTLALLAWTTLIAMGTEYSFSWMRQQAYASWNASRLSAQPGALSMDLVPTYLGRSEGSQEFRITLTLDPNMAGEKVKSGTCEMTLRLNGDTKWRSLLIDLADGSYTVKDEKDKQVAKGPSVDDQTIEAWFKGAGIDVEQRGVRRSMKDAAKFANYAKNDPAAIETGMQMPMSSQDAGALRNNGRRYGGPRGGMTPPGPSGTSMTVSAIIFGTVYVLGCVGILWRNRCILRPALAPGAAS